MFKLLVWAANVLQCDVDFNALKYVMMSEGEIEPLSKYEELKREAVSEEVRGFLI